MIGRARGAAIDETRIPVRWGSTIRIHSAGGYSVVAAAVTERLRGRRALGDVWHSGRHRPWIASPPSSTLPTARPSRSPIRVQGRGRPSPTSSLKRGHEVPFLKRAGSPPPMSTAHWNTRPRPPQHGLPSAPKPRDHSTQIPTCSSERGSPFQSRCRSCPTSHSGGGALRARPRIRRSVQ